MFNRAQNRFATEVIMQMIFVLGPCALVSAQQMVAAPSGKTAPGVDQALDMNTIVSRMTSAQMENHERVRAYTVIRQYTLQSGTNDNSDSSDSRVVAEVSFMPPGKKEYEIRETSGSGRSEKVIRRVLDHETQMTTTWNNTAVTGDNYNFTLLGREQSKDCTCFVLGITPKREAKDLLKGRVYVDMGSFQIQRMEGELAKSPSWWVKHVNVTLYFNNVSGMWLQTAAYADADVRLFGHHVLQSRDLDYRTASTMASNTASHRDATVVRTGARNNSNATRSRSAAIPVLGSGVVMSPR
jgi:hypothetical protein